MLRAACCVAPACPRPGCQYAVRSTQYAVRTQLFLVDRNPQRKRTPPPRRARHTNVTPEQLREPARHEQAEAGPAETASEARVELRERLEETRNVLGRDADTGVHDLEDEPFALARDRQRHRSLLGELHRVSTEIHQDASHHVRIGANRGRVFR